MADVATAEMNPAPGALDINQVHSSVAPSFGSASLAETPGTLDYLGNFFKSIFKDSYNRFRFIGYMAVINYSQCRRFFERKLGLPDDNFEPVIQRPDWDHKPRMIVNLIETCCFLGAAIAGFAEDQKKFRQEIGMLVGAECGKDADKVSLFDILKCKNPVVQSATNRFKSLYALRFIHPFSFLWGLKLGASATVFQIVAERATYFEKNSYDQLHNLMKEVNHNQWGSWSKDEMVPRLVDIIQKTRLEHNTSPVSQEELEQYKPLLQAIGDRITYKDWGFEDALYVLGKIIKNPANQQEATEAYDKIQEKSFSGMVKLSPQDNVTASSYSLQATEEPKIPQNIKNIVEQGPTPLSLRAAEQQQETTR